MRVNNLNDIPMKTRTLILYYSLLFAVVAAGVFFVFIIFGKSFLQDGDGFRQGYFWTAEIKHIVESVLDGNGLPLWNWSRGLGMQSMYRADPFNLFAALFPIKYLELGISISLVLKLYCGGLAFLFLAREMKLSNFQCLMGPICYVFTTWLVNVTMIQSAFIFISFMLPLLMLSIDWVYRGKTPLLFIAVVAYFLIRDAYLSYMAAIVAVLYMLLRYFVYNEAFNAKQYFKTVGQFICYGLIAALVSAAFSSQFILAVFQASTGESSQSMDFIETLPVILDIFRKLVTTGLTYGYSYIGLPILSLLVLPIAIKKVSIKNTVSLMTVILLVMTVFPFFNHMFNGFGYATGRWYIMIAFFASWAAMECFDLEALKSKINVRMMIIWLAVLIAGTLGFDLIGKIDISLRGKAFLLLNFMAGAAIIFVIAAFQKSKFTLLHRQLATICIACLVLMASWSLSFYLYQDRFLDVGEVSAELDQSTQRVISMIDDDDFYRVDQVDWIYCHRNMGMPDCESLWFQSKGIYVYDSFTSSELLRFNKELGNNYGYMMRVYILSNDNRMGLDFLQGVKYFLGDNSKSGQYGSSEYAGYGFSYMDTIDGVKVYKSKYDSGLGFAYDKCISESEFLKLNRFEREQAILQAIVVPDEQCREIRDVSQVKASDIETDVKKVNYEVTDVEDGVTISDGVIHSEIEDGSFDIKVSNVDRSQLIVSFDNLQRAEGQSFCVCCEDGRTMEIAHAGLTNQSIHGVVDFDSNMGYYDSFNGSIHISLNHAGNYSFDSLNVYAMSVDNYDKYAKERVDQKYNITKYNDHKVSGNVNLKSDGIVYFSIPQYTNWDVYVDGEKTEKLTNVNMAYMGVQVAKGKHEIVLKYNNVSLKYGILLSILGLILAAIVEIWHRKHKKY